MSWIFLKSKSIAAALIVFVTLLVLVVLPGKRLDWTVSAQSYNTNPTNTPTNTPTDTSTPTPTNTPTDTSTPTPTNTPTNTPTDTSTPTPTNTPTDTSTPTPTNTPTNTPTVVKYHGCTPGYYKNHLKSWQGYSPNQTVSSVFSSAASYPNIGSATLLAATQFKGGNTVEEAAQILLRATVPALLNATIFGNGYPLTTSQIIAAVNSALDSHNRSTILTLASQLDKYNNAGCPLS